MATSIIKTSADYEDVSSKARVSAAWTSVPYKRFIRRGKRIEFEVEGYCTAYNSNYMYDMVILDSSIKPKNTATFLGFRTDGQFNVQGFHTVLVNPSGKIQVDPNSTSGSYWFISGWYEIA